ncbi:hypothetical protein PIB30_021920 [Stylosanthes scabra]|uniref:Uncharacterized protein n=1 Tax=Stylosanthes scabra TaxID=79078 RepID=A0ABU6T8W9_9FABA|nr:hypothetical protein [Stylosanthes scabra]
MLKKGAGEERECRNGGWIESDERIPKGGEIERRGREKVSMEDMKIKRVWYPKRSRRRNDTPNQHNSTRSPHCKDQSDLLMFELRFRLIA